MREKPNYTSDYENQWSVISHILINNSHDRQLGLLGRKDQVTHTAESRVFAGTGYLHLKHAIKVDRASENFIACSFVDWKRFTGDVGLVDRTLTTYYFSICCYIIAWANSYFISNFKLRRCHLLFFTTNNPPRLGGGELYQGGNRGTRPGCGATFDQLTQEHKKGNDTSGLVSTKLRFTRCHGS